VCCMCSDDACSKKKDFCDGLLLAKLLVVLSKQEITRLKEAPAGRKLQRFECLGNLTASFEFMKRVGVKISNIGPEDVLTGNVKLIQGLIWTLINFFLVEVEPDEGEAAMLTEGAGGRKLTAKQRILEWVKVIVNAYPGVNVQNWRSSFADGLALCALVHFHAPRELDYYALNKEDPKANVRLVFDLLHRRWGIPHLVDPEDVLACKAEEDTMVALIATCKKELKTVPEPDSVSALMSAQESPEEEAQWESRKLLKEVLERAKAGDRAGMDEAMVAVLKAFRDVLQETEDMASSATVKRQADIHAVRQRLDRALRDLMTDAVSLCQHPRSAVHKRLTRRDVMALCAAENEIMRLCGDDADLSKKVLIERLRSLRTNTDAARIMQVSKLLEQENTRLTEATKTRLQARESQLESANSKVAHLMIAELECMSPLFAPLAAKLAVDPKNKETQRELAELNRDITGIMADLDVTLAVVPSQELASLLQAVTAALEKVRTTTNFTLDSSQKIASHVGSRCQKALASTRSSCDAMPRQLARPILQHADELDDSLTQLQFVSDTTQDLETPLVQMVNHIRALTQALQAGEDFFRKESAVPDVRDAVANLLVAIRAGDAVAVSSSSASVQVGGKRALDLGKARAPTCPNAELANNFVRDLGLLLPLHDEAAHKAVADIKDRAAWRRAAETGRDVLSVVTDLDLASRPAPMEDEFASLQAMLVLPIGELEAFEVVNESRDVADAARQAVAEDPLDAKASDILSTIAELELALPAIAENKDKKAAQKLASSLPSLQKAVKTRDKKRAEEKLEAPEDDLVRLSRYARAGVEEQEMKQVQEGVTKKSKKWAEKQKKKARDMADPIRQQRIMEAVADLEAMAPLQMEAFSSFLEEPELVLARDAFDELSEGLAATSGEVSCLFPDLLLVTPIDLDSAICALETDTRDVSAPAPVLRKLDLETLVPHGPSLVTAPEMLQLEALDTPLSSRRRTIDGHFKAEPHAQRVVECLAGDGGEDDEQVLEGEEFADALDDFIAKLSVLSERVNSLPNEATRLLPEAAVATVDEVCGIIRRGKRVAASLPPDREEESPVLYGGLEDLANRVADMVFSVQEYLDATVDASIVSPDDTAAFKASCGAVSKQLKQLQQLAVSQSLLLSVDKLDIPSAASALAGANATLDKAMQENSVQPLEQPKPELLDRIKAEARRAAAEWQWDPFLAVTAEALRRMHSLVPQIHDSGRRVLVRQAGEALLGRAKQLLATSVHKPAELPSSINACVEACEALGAACALLDAKAFRPVRTMENTKGAARIHNALIEGVSLSPKAGEIYNRIKLVQDRISPLTQELRHFKQAPSSFAPGDFIELVVEILGDTGLICRGLEDLNTKTLLQGLREQLSETGIAFLFCVLDVVAYPTKDCEDDSFVALKRLSLALLQLGKWARKAFTTLQPARSIASDADTARIMRQLKALRSGPHYAPAEASSASAADIGTIRGLVIGVADALNSTERTMRVPVTSIDPSDVGDAMVHVVLVVGSLSKHFGHDGHVMQMCGMVELLAHGTFEVIFRVRDLALPVGNPMLVEEAVREALQLIGKVRGVTEVLSAKLVKLGELRTVGDALDQCEQLLGDPLPTPPRCSSLGDFERILKRETVLIVGLCGGKVEALDFNRFGTALVSCAGVVRNNCSIINDGGSTAAIVRVTSTMVGSGQKVLRVLEKTATSDVGSDAHHAAHVSLREEVKTVSMLASKLEEMVGEACMQQQQSGGQLSVPSSSPPEKTHHRSSSSSSSGTGSGSNSNTTSPGGSPVTRQHARQTLLIGKALSVAVSELGKKQTAVFSHADEMPSGLSGSLERLSPTESKIHQLLTTQKPGPDLQRALLYFLNLIKHLVSGYLKKDTGEKLGELVRRTKDWASKVILAMQAMEQQEQIDPKEARQAMEYLHEYLVTSVVLCCSVCKQAISGTFTTADGAVFHNACFKCETCKKPISVSICLFVSCVLIKIAGFVLSRGLQDLLLGRHSNDQQSHLQAVRRAD
jgi:hypothetical protein